MKYVPRLVLFLAIPALLFVLPWWTLVAAPTEGTSALFWLGSTVFLLGYLTLPAAMFLGHGPKQSDAAAAVGDTMLGVMWVLFSWSVIGTIVRLGSTAIGVPDSARIVAVGVLAVATALVGWGIFEARRVPRVRTVEVAIPGLARGLDGLRMVVITDTHYGPLDRQAGRSRSSTSSTRSSPISPVTRVISRMVR